MKSAARGFCESSFRVEIDGRAETRSWIQRAVVTVFMVSCALVSLEAAEGDERAIIEQVRKRISSRISAAALLISSV